MTPKRATKTTVKPQDQDTQQIIQVENFSLQSIGAYMLFSAIDEASAQDLCEFLIKANYVFPPEQPLTLLINSPGGVVYDAFGIIDLIECSKLEIQTVAIGAVASMAALIFTAGTKGKRIMSRNSYIMTHQFSQGVEARYHEFVAQRSHEDELHNRFVEHFVRHTKMSEKQVNDILLGTADKWISAKEALKYGLCDKIQDPWE
jgi:ATP-dependent Clp endopeptidase proteolytic subunit ClpP